ncbi:C2 domain-containing protein 5 isoform X2 [Lepeophtheirus salmonis]|uniref:C2 domain-containing protein 5 isoform X2 n=1 Tax=Lepeophtheirus salmonis TaxID=72036 RepID=UPI001AEB7FE4|nr:C2 domain-containing protein 5-like isoform X2 [Lepeophtheirus salmonis]
MPGKVKVRILSGRNLPIMDRSAETTDAFAEVKFSETTFKTEVFRKSLNPEWNSDWFRFHADDRELQDEPLQIRVMDYDTYSANDAIGKVYVDLNPLLLLAEDSSSGTMSGWLPIFDTMQGLRGEIKILVKVELFSDLNKFRQSSCGVQFYCSSGIPEGFQVVCINGFVEELVVNDDPEYQWIDKIRTPRASNEARQSLFMKLSGAVQRKIGLKALELGANAVVGYHQRFDFEGDTGIVVRGIGTAVTLQKPNANDPPSNVLATICPDLHGSESRPSFNSIPRLQLTPASPVSQNSPPFFNPLRRSTFSNFSTPTHISNHDIEKKQIKPVFDKLEEEENASDDDDYQLYELKKSNEVLHSDSKLNVCTSNKSQSTCTKTMSSPILNTVAHLPHRDYSFRLESNFKEGNSSLVPDILVPRKYSLKSVMNKFKLITTPSSSMHKLSDPPSFSTSVLSDHKRAFFQMDSDEEESEDECQDFWVSSISDMTTANALLGGSKSHLIFEAEAERITYGMVDESRANGVFEGKKEIGTLTNSINSIPTIPYASKQSMNRHGLAADSLEFLEYPFITMTKFPPGFLFHLGGFVSTRSVKLLDDLEEDSVTRDGWWQEIRREIRSHARALGCSIIVGYSEEITIWEDVVVLYASGTAALGNMRMMLDLDMAGNFGPPFIHAVRPLLTQVQSDHASNCKLYHVPYAEGSLPFPVKMTNCAVCGRKKVPDVLITTIEPSNSSDFVGRGSFIQAKVVKYKKDLKGDNNAKEISDALPFLEYEIHRQLLNKLKVKGMNSLFDLKIKISISSRLICAIASATSVFTSALPIPDKPRLLLSSSSDDKHKNTSSVLIEKDHLDRTTKRLEEKVSSNILHYDITSHQIKSVLEQGQTDNNVEEVPDRENEEIEVDFSAGNKDACVLEIDDSEDADILNSLLDPLPPKDFYIYSTEEPVGIPPGHIITSCQTFTQVWRGKVHPTSKEYGIACQNLLSLVYFKLRSFRPCLICKLNFQLNYDDENEMQIILNGTAISIDNSSKTTKKDDSFFSSSSMLNGGGNSMIFNLECDSSSHNKIVKPCRFYVANKEGQGVNVTPLSYIPGARIERYMGNLNFFLIRETSSLRESGGLNTFIQSFINEFYGIVRAHVYALGGNGLVAFFMSEFVLSHSLHKNQAQCLIHVGGDVVSAHYTTLTL